MAAQEKIYYPWELWSKAIRRHGMHFVHVKFSRIEYDSVCSATIAVPTIRTEVIDGVPRKLLYWQDAYYRANGMAYDKTGHRMIEFDLNLEKENENYGK